MCKDTISTFKLMPKTPYANSARKYIEFHRWGDIPTFPSCENNEFAFRLNQGNVRDTYNECINSLLLSSFRKTIKHSNLIR